MLLRAALVIALVRDGRDDAGLVVVPAEGRDVGERAELRARTVGGDREARAQRSAVREPELRDALARRPMRDRRGDALDLEPIAERRERADDIIVEGHVSERLDRPWLRNPDA